ncbi:Ser/Thr protein kinase RdoA (MazF antagonist) [Bacillus tianshenii]|uniref:Ser/Thr protein kinase RdoA (MazF antagonist) n=1 Tax=Sutcliffiella tianshenii TaxID=1463404 RepID=A0ABS2P591_9BACI|nr:phosphotransferase [Bacillus tianshenii]MBM7622126.1 Ser/Thr protein kinase RdoA (MazF antagonist) [Bacillus tianshenii]
MMKLSTMKKVADTVCEDWRSPVAVQIMKNWEYDEGELYYFRASANFVFLFKKEGQVYYLRFHEATEKPISQLESEMNVLHFLNDGPVKVAQPLLSKNDRYIEIVETDVGIFSAMVFEGIPGKQMETEELVEKQFYIWGRTLGMLHEKLKMLPLEYSSKRPSYTDHLHWIDSHLPKDDLPAREELSRIKEWASTLRKTQGNFGIIHFDFEVDNLRWNGDRIGAFDFDESAGYWYVADIVFALRDVLSNKEDIKKPQVRNFLSGYRSATKLDEDDLQQIDGFLRMHQLYTYTRIHRSADIPKSNDTPEWLSTLSGKLDIKLSFYRSRLCRLKN